MDGIHSRTLITRLQRYFANGRTDLRSVTEPGFHHWGATAERSEAGYERRSREKVQLGVWGALEAPQWETGRSPGKFCLFKALICPLRCIFSTKMHYFILKICTFPEFWGAFWGRKISLGGGAMPLLAPPWSRACQNTPNTLLGLFSDMLKVYYVCLSF